MLRFYAKKIYFLLSNALLSRCSCRGIVWVVKVFKKYVQYVRDDLPALKFDRFSNYPRKNESPSREAVQLKR